MSSNKKSTKFNKTRGSGGVQHRGSQQQQNTAIPSTKNIRTETGKTSAADPNASSSSIHKVWPDLQLNQSNLFFECTLFLYSVLALFLQYLNLYRTLWWLPKSHWHYSIKYHLINPYLLSCIGLLLGVRVTKCFWDTISERIDFLTKGQNGWQLTCWKVFEYAIVKTPLTTIVTTSFLFSFSRIYAEFGFKSIACFVGPFVLNILLFKRAAICRLFEQIASSSQLFSRFFSTSITNDQLPQDQLIDLDSYVHLCETSSAQIRDEATLLMRDFRLRCWHCIYAGFITAYFAIFMPRAFSLKRTMHGHPQKMLIDDLWVLQLLAIVALTAFSLYMTYLFPINYIDLLYRNTVHLGHWELAQQPSPTATPIMHQQQRSVRGQSTNDQSQQQYENFEQFNELRPLPYPDGMRLVHNGELYIARTHPHHRSVCAEPGNKCHQRLYRLAHNPVALVTSLCLFQTALVAFEFWLLLLTSDWQQIVTIVLLMFANYLLLAKLFKDRVVIGRIYNPSDEDMQLIKQLREESARAQKALEQQKQQQQQQQVLQQKQQQQIQQQQQQQQQRPKQRSQQKR